MTEPVALAVYLGKLPQTCGHHCGIRSQAEGGHTWEAHCKCGECRCPIALDPAAPGWGERAARHIRRRYGLPRRAPMCGLPSVPEEVAGW
jgi:hypothetical protein